VRYKAICEPTGAPVETPLMGPPEPTGGALKTARAGGAAGCAPGGGCVSGAHVVDGQLPMGHTCWPADRAAATLATSSASSIVKLCARTCARSKG
jgi:hypothetical protein